MIAIIGPTLVLCLLIAYEIRKNSKIERMQSEEFWEKEAEANLTRKKDISGLDYIEIPLAELPIGLCPAFEELNENEAMLKRLASRKILNLKGMTNTEIKREYGIANFDFICQCDECFLQLLQLLSKEAELLYSMSFEAEAESVLDYAVSIGSDIPKDYLLLANIYKSRFDAASIDRLILLANSFESATKFSLIEKLEAIKASI